MNSSVPLSPPLMAAALTRMPTITTTIAQNSVVLNAFLVSVVRRRSAPPPRTWVCCCATFPAERFGVVILGEPPAPGVLDRTKLPGIGPWKPRSGRFAQHGGGTQRMRVLIADDEDDVRDLLAEMIRR